MAQRRDVASAIASSLKNINIGDESVSASPSSPSIFINSVTQSNRTPASLWPVHGLTGADDNQSVDSLFLHTDTVLPAHSFKLRIDHCDIGQTVVTLGCICIVLLIFFF